MYVCNCNEGVIGKNCTGITLFSKTELCFTRIILPECEDEGYCNEPNGICLVNDTGKPQCTCYKGFKGDNCECEYLLSVCVLASQSTFVPRCDYGVYYDSSHIKAIIS